MSCVTRMPVGVSLTFLHLVPLHTDGSSPTAGTLTHFNYISIVFVLEYRREIEPYEFLLVCRNSKREPSGRRSTRSKRS